MKSFWLGSLLALTPLTLTAAPADDVRTAIAELDKASSYSWVISVRNHSYFPDQMRIVQAVGHKLPGGLIYSSGPIIWPPRPTPGPTLAYDPETLIRTPGYEMAIAPSGGAIRLYENIVEYTIDGPRPQRGGGGPGERGRSLPPLTNAFWESIGDLTTGPAVPNQKFRDQFSQAIHRAMTPSARAAILLQGLDDVRIADGVYSGKLSVTAIKSYLAIEGIPFDGDRAIADLTGQVTFRLQEGKLSELSYVIRGIYLRSRPPGLAAFRNDRPELGDARPSDPFNAAVSALGPNGIGSPDTSGGGISDFRLEETVVIGRVGSAQQTLSPEAATKTAAPLPVGWAQTTPILPSPLAPSASLGSAIQSTNAPSAINPTEAVLAAIKKLNETTGYSWKQVAGGSMFVTSKSPLSILNSEGKFAKPGLFQFKGSAQGPRPARVGGAGGGGGAAPRLAYEVALDDATAFYRPQEAVNAAPKPWESLDSLPRSNPLPVNDALFIQEFVRLAKTFRSPVELAASLAEKCVFVRIADGLFRAEILDPELQLFLAGQAMGLTFSKDITGSMRVWVEDGFITKFDLNILGVGAAPDADPSRVPTLPATLQQSSFKRTFEFFDIGTTKIVKPVLGPSTAL